jgi:acetyl esterase/lipase
MLSLVSCSRSKAESPQVYFLSSTLTPEVKEQAKTKPLTLVYGPPSIATTDLLDFRLPSEGKPPYPLIIYIHGGGWYAGDKSPLPSLLLLTNGYAVASINYRLTNEARFPAQIEDCKLAVTWLRSHASWLDIDPNRIGVWGASAGGHLAALIGTTGDAQSPAWAAPPPGTSNRVEAVCDWCGPSDLISLEQQYDPKRNIKGAVTHLLGGPVSKNIEFAKEASPTSYVHKGCPPFLIMHGDKDWLVPLQQSQELSDALKSQGVDCTFDTVPGEHNFYTPENERKVVDFFDRTLKQRHN